MQTEKKEFNLYTKLPQHIWGLILFAGFGIAVGFIDGSYYTALHGLMLFSSLYIMVFHNIIKDFMSTKVFATQTVYIIFLRAMMIGLILYLYRTWNDTLTFNEAMFRINLFSICAVLNFTTKRS